MIDYRKIIRNQELRLDVVNWLKFIPSVPYLKLVYRIKTGRKLNLKNPVGFNEKLNWLKLHDKHPEYTDLADKYKVREIIKEKLGDGYSIPLLGVWDRFEDIDFAQLPDRFVLKCSHDSGSVRIIKDKSELDEKKLEELRVFYTKHLKRNPYNSGREYPYRKIRPRILAEQYMEVPGGIDDYKFFCFNGDPKLMFVATDRSTDCRFDFFDMEFNHLDIYNIHPNADRAVSKPALFEKMKQISATLSQGIKHVRIDLYEINGQIYVGEYTFFHGGGFWLFNPEEWERRLGDWIEM